MKVCNLHDRFKIGAVEGYDMVMLEEMLLLSLLACIHLEDRFTKE